MDREKILVHRSLIIRFTDALDFLKRIKPVSGVFILLLVLGFTFYVFKPVSDIVFEEDHYPFVENYAKFTIELNCTLPNVPEKMEILHVEGSSINETEIHEIATNVFKFKNYSIQHKNNRIVLRSGNRTLLTIWPSEMTHTKIR